MWRTLQRAALGLQPKAPQTELKLASERHICGVEFYLSIRHNRLILFGLQKLSDIGHKCLPVSGTLLESRRKSLDTNKLPNRGFSGRDVPVVRLDIFDVGSGFLAGRQAFARRWWPFALIDTPGESLATA